jgi:hypothetical protein
LENDSALRVSKESPGDSGVFELVDGDFASESSLRLVKDVLCCDFKAGAEMFACEEEIKSWWGNDNLCE